MAMPVTYPRCAGLDVHQKSVVACRLVQADEREPVQATRTFSTMRRGLIELAAWLQAADVTHVAMESTGVYWQPVYNVLEHGFPLLLVNPHQIKKAPGRKTDVQDAAWLAQLLRHGLVRGSFVPDQAQRELRELTRYRTTLVREHAAEINRVQKTLEGANIKLGAVVSDIVGVSSRAMLEAVIDGAGGQDASRLAQMAKGRMRCKIAELEQALDGEVHEHHRFILARRLAHLDGTMTLADDLDAEIARRLEPWATVRDRLDAIPGIGRRVAEVILAELGPRVDRFPSAGDLTAWAGLAPGSHVSAGARRRVGTRKGNCALREALVEAALAAAKTQTALGQRFRRLARRLGRKKAAVALARHMLVVIYHMLRDGAAYREPDPVALDARQRERLCARLVARLRELGLEATLTPIEPGAAPPPQRPPDAMPAA